MEEVEKFYEWLEKMRSIHLADNYKMDKAYKIVYENSQNLKRPKVKFNLNKKPIEKCTQSI